MRLQRLERTQRLRTSLLDAWAFFADPRNLSRITPPWLGFQVRSPLPERMYPGLVIVYTVQPLLGIPVEWVTEITHVAEPYLFVDEQRFGPYRFWHHEHHFREVPGGVEVRDLVHYALPGGWVGSRLLGPVVAARLREIFDYRRTVLAGLFGELP